MALAHPGFVQKVMERVMPQSWAVRRDKVTPMPKSPMQRSQVVNEKPDSALRYAPTPWLGLLGRTVTPDVALAMNLASDQRGVLVEEVQQQGPADRAHLREGSQAFVSHGHRRLIGGDVIVALDGQGVSRLKDMQALLQSAQPGQTVTLTLLQGKEQRQVRVTLVWGPASILSPSLATLLQRRSSYTPQGYPVPAQPPVGRTPLRGGDSDLAAF